MNYSIPVITFSFSKDLEQDDCNDKELSQDTQYLFLLPEAQPV